ncbi:MAG: PIN domain nuclease [Trichlorobacter sp.]|uniref:type II toxin-antitoxin system VapC family toxin n=1 Tax=Trichlorobacter sp. TaxID=2911007 RepID=UPI002568E8FB|nr:PIN domain nuclease [Trichlorobacter sp.]MDK9717835.1 PIN domain nuclease [Trichlorobacter sp.]
MVLVDTSIWIDFFQAPDSPTAEILARLISGHNQVMLCGVVLQEVLQGIRGARNFDLVQERLLRFPFVDADKETWLQAASLYRGLRAKGITIPTIDATIAALTMQHNLLLFSRDRHFEAIAADTTLRLY